MKECVFTKLAPSPGGAYSQAIKVGNTVYLAGQIPLDPNTQTLVSNEFREQVQQVFYNLSQVCEASGGSLKAVVKLSIYLTQLIYFPVMDDLMKTFFKAPYPARTTIEVSALPKGALIEIDAIMVLDHS